MSGPEPAAPPKPLTPAERALLQKRAPDGSSEQVPLEGRLMEQLTVRGLEWAGSSWRRLRAEHVTFVDCTLSGVHLDGATLLDVTFERCTLVSCRFGDGVFERTRFVGSTIQAGRARRAKLRACRLQDTKLDGLLLESCEVTKLQQEGGALSDVQLSECTVEAWTTRAASISGLRFTLCRGGPLLLSACEVEGLALRGGRWSQVELRGGSLRDVAITEVEAKALLLADAQLVASLNVNDCQLALLTITHCLRVFDLYLFESELRRVLLSHGTFTGWMTKCKLGPGSRVEHATLAGFFWDESESRELVLQQVTFTVVLCARDAVFRGLRLIDVTYADDLGLTLDGATFTDSDRFGAKP